MQCKGHWEHYSTSFSSDIPANESYSRSYRHPRMQPGDPLLAFPTFTALGILVFYFISMLCFALLYFIIKKYDKKYLEVSLI